MKIYTAVLDNEIEKSGDALWKYMETQSPARAFVAKE